MDYKYFLKKFGLYAPVIFIIFQSTQVVLSILPGAISCVEGILIFGSLQGFIYNYIGSIAVFLLARQYGSTYVKSGTKVITILQMTGVVIK